jgi:hypothetical protein
MMAGPIELREPRLRGLEQRFESLILPLFARRAEEVSELVPQLYLHGLTRGDFELALGGLLGEGAPLSPSSIERLRAKWQLAGCRLNDSVAKTTTKLSVADARQSVCPAFSRETELPQSRGSSGAGQRPSRREPTRGSKY